MNKPPYTIHLLEWVLSSCLLLLLLSLFIIAKIQASRFGHLIPPQPKTVELTISGAVSHPGAYVIEEGTPISAVLEKVKPTQVADLSGIDQKEKVTSSRVLHLSEIKELSIRIEGAVKIPMDLIVPLGTRLSDLKPYLELKKEADKSFFKRKRLLKNKEIVVVPSKG